MDGAETKELPESPDYLAPDGSEIRLLVEGTRGGMAHFTLPARTVSRAVRHRTVEELWYVVSGSGEMWRQPSTEPDGLVDLRPGVSLSIAVGTTFQFRAGEREGSRTGRRKSLRASWCGRPVANCMRTPHVDVMPT